MYSWVVNKALLRIIKKQNNWIPVEQYKDKETNKLLYSFYSMTEAAKNLGVSVSLISTMVSGKKGKQSKYKIILGDKNE